MDGFLDCCILNYRRLSFSSFLTDLRVYLLSGFCFHSVLFKFFAVSVAMTFLAIPNATVCIIPHCADSSVSLQRSRVDSRWQLVATAQGLEQLATISATGFFRSLYHLATVDPVSICLADITTKLFLPRLILRMSHFRTPLQTGLGDRRRVNRAHGSGSNVGQQILVCQLALVLRSPLSPCRSTPVVGSLIAVTNWV